MEIEETRLHRVLTFRNQRGEVFTCSAESGRLLTVHDAAEVEVPDLSDATELQRSALAQKCKGFLSQTTSLTVESAWPDTHAPETGIGLALSSEFLGISETQPGAAPFKLDEFVSSIEAMATATVRIDAGQISSTNGCEPQKGKLIALAQEEVASSKKTRPDPTTEHFVLLSTHPENSGQSAICAAIADTVLFAAFPAAELKNVLESWAECRA
ncbi:MAG: hypothetical protein AAGA08_08465 [Pseudomonadota bacterium]